MNNLQQKFEHLKFLRTIGLEYYCSEKKDRENFLITIKSQIPLVETPKLLVSNNKSQEVVIKQNKQSHTDTLPVDLEASSLAEGAKSLDELRGIVENFNGCALKHFASNTVFADGQQNAKILLIGEAPGATEDEQAIPFCGESGKLLDAMLNTIGISRTKNAYITNVVFWRPPANRKPTIDEINICRPFVEKHIAILKPKLIILVGSTAIAALLGKNESISNIRENNYNYINKYMELPVVTTAIFHPAYLLRQPMQKKATWFDLLKIKKLLPELGIEL